VAIIQELQVYVFADSALLIRLIVIINVYINSSDALSIEYFGVLQEMNS